MMTLLFFGFPSGLNLYYFMFNLLSIGQQYYTTKIRPPKEDEIKKPVKTFMLSKGEGRAIRPLFFEKPPARIASYSVGMSFDAAHRSGVVLSQKKEREVKLNFRKAKGSVSDCYISIDSIKPLLQKPKKFRQISPT